MRVCPSCSKEYRSRSKGRCRECETEIYHGTHNKKPLTILKSEKDAVDNLMTTLENFVSERDGVSIHLDYRESSRERSFLYSLVERARLFLSHQKSMLGWTAATFVVDLINYVLSLAWWRDHLNSFLQLSKHVQKLAKEMYILRRDEAMSEAAAASTFLDDPAFVEGVYS